MRRPIPPSSEIEPQFSCDEVAADPADLAQRLHALVAFSALGDLAGGLGDLAVEIADQRNQAVESAAVRRAVAARRVTRGRLCRTDRRTRVGCPGGPAARARGSRSRCAGARASRGVSVRFTHIRQSPIR